MVRNKKKIRTKNKMEKSGTFSRTKHFFAVTRSRSLMISLITLTTQPGEALLHPALCVGVRGVKPRGRQTPHKRALP